MENRIDYKKLKRYKSFKSGDLRLFSDLFRDHDYDLVQIHDATPLEDSKDVIGFAGVFKWQNNKIIPLDGDIYTSQMPVIAYKKFDHKNNDGSIEKCLDILVEEW